MTEEELEAAMKALREMYTGPPTIKPTTPLTIKPTTVNFYTVNDGDWYPTAQLRFHMDPARGKILQQRWRRYPSHEVPEEQWRDVPMVYDNE